MMATILIVRAQRMVNLNKKMGWKLQKAEQDMVLEQSRRQEHSQFLKMLMHELQNSMQVVTLALGTKNNREENLEHAGRAVQDMKAIIDRCVNADQMGQLTLQRNDQPLNLAALMREVGQYIPFLSKRLHIVAADNLSNIHTDIQLIQIVLTNLLDNATRYSDPATPVTASVEPGTVQNKPGLTVRVRNTPGPAGWPDDQQIFSKYYRSSGAQSKSGSGLGLYLSRQLTERLGGSLDYRPNAQYVEFTLWIPLSPA